MKVILLESIKKLGSKGDIVEVSDGQAKNFLIPKKMAEEATSKNINVLNQRNKSIERKEDQLLDNAKITEKKINDIDVFIKAKENNGKLFGSITNSKNSSELNKHGIKVDKKNIEEDEPTQPILSYSASKAQNEKQLKSSGKNCIILRLGSVYGYSNDSMRIDIMPNLFSKIASQNGTLKLFSGGRQIKSLVPLIDVARCFKFMEEKNDINSEIFNLTKDTLTAVSYTHLTLPTICSV